MNFSKKLKKLFQAYNIINIQTQRKAATIVLRITKQFLNNKISLLYTYGLNITFNVQTV